MNASPQSQVDPQQFVGRKAKLLFTCGSYNRGEVTEIVSAWYDRERLFFRLQNDYEKDHSVVSSYAVTLIR